MRRRTMIAIIIFAALFGLVMMTLMKPQERNLTRLVVPAIAPETAEKIVVDEGDPFELLKEGESWVLDDGRPADHVMIERALRSLESLSTTELVSSNPETHAAYEVDAEKGRRVTVFVQSEPALDVIVGKASTLTGMYVRLSDDDDVYLARRSPVRSYFPSSKSDWQRLQLFDVELADVVSLGTDVRDGIDFTFVQEDDAEWVLGDMSVLPEGFRFDGAKARSIVSMFLDLRAKEIMVMSPDPEASGLRGDDGSDNYSLALQNGVVHALVIGSKDAEQSNYYAQMDATHYMFVPIHAVDNLRKDLEYFRALNLMEFNPDSVMTLSIKSDDELRVFLKTDGAWTVAENSVQPSGDFVLNGVTVDQAIRTLSRLDATSFIAEGLSSVETNLHMPAFEITVTTGENEIATLLLGGTVKEEHTDMLYYARGNIDSGTYLVQERDVAQFTASGFTRWN